MEQYGSFSYKQSSPLTPRNLLSSSPSENLLKIVKNYKILDKKFYYPQSIVSISGSVCPNVCPSVWVPSWNSTFLQQNVPECMQNVPECSKMHAECSKMHAECSKMHAECSRIHAECSRMHAECSRMYAECSWMHANPIACMQVHELACNYISLHAVT